MNEDIFSISPLIKTDRLIMKLHTLEDVEDMFVVRSHPKVMKYLDTNPAENTDVVRDRIVQIIEDFKHKKAVNLTIRLQSNPTEAIGYMSLWRIDKHNNRGEIGYALKDNYWGKGYAIEAGKALLDYSFNKAELHSLMANINPHNQSSRNLLLKLGFQKEAYHREDFFFNGEYLDSEIYGMTLSDYKAFTNH